VISLVESGAVSVGHAKVLLSISDEKEISRLAEKVANESLSVRQLEELVKKGNKKPQVKKEVDLNLRLAFETIEKNVSSHLGTKVKIIDNHNKGKIQIDYYSAKDLERIIEIIQK